MAAEVAVKILSGESAPRVPPEQVQRAALGDPTVSLCHIPPYIACIPPHAVALAELCRSLQCHWYLTAQLSVLLSCSPL